MQTQANLAVTDPKVFGKVAVLMGGQSAERNISLSSGTAVLAALITKKIDAYGIDLSRNTLMELHDQNINRVFIILHGRGGEDGSIQGALELLGMPYTGSGILASALGINKLLTKQLWTNIGLPTPKFRLTKNIDELTDIALAIGFPVAVKPSCEGSSIGVSRVDHKNQLVEAWAQAAACGSEVLVEKWIIGEEYTGAILHGQALPLIRLKTSHHFYDYEAKYQADDTIYVCPCGLTKQQELELQNMVLLAYATIGGYGWGRVDFIVDEFGQPWLLEVNTIPGMTNHSLFPMAARVAGLSFEELVWKILETSINRF